MLTFDEYKQLTNRITRLTMLRARETRPGKKAHYTKCIKRTNERISILLHSKQ